MKNNRSYRLPALLLAAMMVIGVFPAAAFAGVSNSINPLAGNYNLSVQDASYSYASDGKAVSSLEELDPNKISTMTVTVPDSDALPQNTISEMYVAVPENVVVTAADVAAFQSDDVTMAYRTVKGKGHLVFKWKNEAKPGFAVTVPITTQLPATREDVSGTWVLTVNNKNGIMVVQPTIKDFSGTKRLTAVQGTILYDRIYRAGTNLSKWNITHVTGDWYSISSGGQYINYGKNGNNISLTDTPQYFRYASYGAGNQFVGYDDNGTRYYLNNKSENVNNGIQASTYDNQYIALYKELKASAGSSLVRFSVNGGSADSKLTPVLVDKHSTITLPEYKGTKNGFNFIGWATTSKIKQNVYYQVYQPGETFEVDEDEVDLYAVWSSKNPERTQFGIRMSGDIPDEPAQYDVGAYSKQHIYKDGAVITGTWIVDTNAAGKPVEGNHVVNAVTANLTVLPTDDEIKIMYPNYDPETMYVHWYVLKYAGQWKVDGVIVSRVQQAEVRYDANVATENKGKIKNIPAAYKVEEGTTITVGAGVDGKSIKMPEYPGYTFGGWNTKADGSGEDYEQGSRIDLTESVTFFAKWEEIPTYQVEYELDGVALQTESSGEEYFGGESITLPKAEAKQNYIFSGWRINGEKAEDASFIMPDENIMITGEYYGPIYIDITTDWPAGKPGYYGAKVNLYAELTKPDNIECDIQWQYQDGDKWVNIPGETEMVMTYELNEDTRGRIWRVFVTDARLIQSDE